ncbi:uncharacterized protein LOC121873920 [Homarus americanus]|uniref:uncharacterized protein LOC121873920 n=1 Tax=Homarus americanus TaxID=6706 RepID=UPI001C443B3E|nr:uncharacterized protein LOC121873920 [Homarus americanus]
MSLGFTVIYNLAILQALILPGVTEEVTVVRLQRMDVASNDSFLDSGKNALPDLSQWTVCVRLRLFHLSRLNTIFSYTTGEHYQEIMLGIDWPQSNLRLECCKYTGFMEMAVPLRLYTWHQICLSADMTKDVQYMIFDDLVHMALIRRPGVTSEQLHKVRGGGRFLVGQNYNPAADLMFIEAIHGDLADFRFYDVALSLEDLRDFASCNAMNDLLYPIYEFELNMTHLKPSGDIELYQMGLEDICTQEPDLVMIIPERIDFETSLAMCNFFTGDIIIPTNPEENVAIYDKYEEFNNYCADSWGTSFWLGVVANHTNGGWTRVPERKPLIWADFLPGWMVPTEEHSCLAFVAINVKYKWAASPCNILQCPICNFTSTPKLHLRGLCDLSKFDRFYSPYDYYNLKPVLEGFFLSRMTWNNHTWLIKSRLDRAVEARMKSNKPNDYPFGLHTWDVKGDACGQDQVQLLLTSCGITDFTCSDGSCIKKIKRCDQEVDCPDNTDELNCDVINIPEGYSAQLAPPAIDSSQLSLHISLDITSIREFDILGFVVAVDITQSIKWRDARLVLRNLRQGNFPNEAKSFDKLWLPDILVKDGTYSPTDLQMRRVRLLVRRDADPLPDDDYNISEDELYRGVNSTLKLLQQYTVRAMCQFLLHAYPFDSQRCSLVYSIPDQAIGKILLLQEEVKFTGERRLLEYELVNETLTAHGNMSAAVQLRLVFQNQYGYYIGNAVVPSLLMATICYLTFFFDLDDFTDRIMVSLTSLLVLAALFTQTSQSIPKTAYLKLIDIWYVTLIITDFLIIVMLVLIENKRMQEKLSRHSSRSLFRSTHKITPVESAGQLTSGNEFEDKMNGSSTARKMNTISKCLFPMLATIGCFCWILIHLQTSPTSHGI